MHIALWILQVLLAVAYLLHGWLFLTAPGNLQEMVGLPPAVRVFIGLAEWLAAAGLVLPGLTGIRPQLTPLAALGLVIVMAGSIVFHLARGEGASMLPNVVLLALLAVVAYGRWKVVPLRQRSAPPARS